MPKPITRPDLLERYEALGYSNRFKFEQKHGLPMNLMGKMKLGAYQSAASAATIARLEAAIASEEDAAKRGHEAPPLPGEAITAAIGRPARQTTLSEDDSDILEELVAAIEESADQAQVDRCNKMATVALLRGVLTDATAKIVQGMLAERRQSIRAKQEREEKAKGNEVLRIEIHNKADWSVPGACPYCAGSGVLS